MALQLPHGRALIVIRQEAYEIHQISRQAIDQRYNLTPDEFRVEEGLVLLGPLPSDDMLPEVIEDLEQNGLVYFDDFFELSGNWPDWLTLYARPAKEPRA
jgi:hypothetical protein